MTDIEKLKKLTGESDEELLSLLLEEAEAFVLSYIKSDAHCKWSGQSSKRPGSNCFKPDGNGRRDRAK